MPGRGVLFALSQIDEAQLLARREGKARAGWVANVLEERWDKSWLHEVDQLWYPVHYCLHGSADYPLPGASAEAKCIFGGEPLGVPGIFSIDYKSVRLVEAIAGGLAKMREDALEARARLVERGEFSGPKGDAVQADIVHAVLDLRDFYRKAADAGRSVIFTVDM